MVRYNRVVTTGVSIELSEDGPEVFLTVSALQPHPVPASSQAAAAALVVLCTEVRGGEISTLRVAFAHPRSACAQRLQAFCHCPVAFGAADTRMTFRRDDLDAPLRTVNVERVRAMTETRTLLRLTLSERWDLACHRAV